MARRVGRPRYEPTNEDRMNVLMWVVAGHTQESIAAQFNRKPSFITRHFKNEWNKGRQQVDGLVVSQLLKRIKAGDTRAIIFYCETRLGWKRGTFVPEEAERQADDVSKWWDENNVPAPIEDHSLPLPGLPTPDPQPTEKTLASIYDEDFDFDIEDL
jgi:hypothetical protein